THLAEPHLARELRGDELSPLLAACPRLAVLALDRALQRGHDLREDPFGERVWAVTGLKASSLRHRDVAANGFRIETELRRDPLLLCSGEPLPKHFLHLHHRDLSVRHRTSRSAQADPEASYAPRPREGGMLLRKSAQKGGMLLRNS